MLKIGKRVRSRRTLVAERLGERLMMVVNLETMSLGGLSVAANGFPYHEVVFVEPGSETEVEISLSDTSNSLLTQAKLQFNGSEDGLTIRDLEFSPNFALLIDVNSADQQTLAYGVDLNGVTLSDAPLSLARVSVRVPDVAGDYIFTLEQDDDTSDEESTSFRFADEAGVIGQYDPLVFRVIDPDGGLEAHDDFSGGCGPLHVPVLANDSITSLDEVEIRVARTAANGTVELDSSGLSLIYDPSSGFAGDDTFTYTLFDHQGHSATANVSIAIPADCDWFLPFPSDDEAYMLVDSNVTIDVLENDSFDGIGNVQASSASNGAVMVNPDNSITYTPHAGFVGQDQFEYQLAGFPFAATVTVHVNQPHVPSIQSVEINRLHLDPPALNAFLPPTSWAAQRTSLRAIDVVFDDVVENTDLDSIQLGRFEIDGTGPMDFIQLRDEHLHVEEDRFRLSFAKSELPDGIFQLVISQAIVDRTGVAIDGDGDGNAGGDYVLRGNGENRLYQLAGDFNGDTGVSIFDFPTFAYWFGQHVGIAPAYVDLNNDYGVSIFDFGSFSANFGLGVQFPESAVGASQAALVVNDAPVLRSIEVEPMREIPIEQDLRIDVEWNLGLPRQRYTDETESGKRLVTESRFSAMLEEVLKELGPSNGGLPSMAGQL